MGWEDILQVLRYSFQLWQHLQIFIQLDMCLDGPALCQAPGKPHMEDRKELDSHCAVLSLRASATHQLHEPGHVP